MLLNVMQPLKPAFHLSLQQKSNLTKCDAVSKPNNLKLEYFRQFTQLRFYYEGNAMNFRNPERKVLQLAKKKSFIWPRNKNYYTIKPPQ